MRSKRHAHPVSFEAQAEELSSRAERIYAAVDRYLYAASWVFVVFVVAYLGWHVLRYVTQP